MNRDIKRRDYSVGALLESQIHENPIKQLQIWLTEAVDAKVVDPNAAVLGTVDAQGAPHGRVVLIKHVDQGRLVFYTNYESEKGQHLAQQPQASLTFLWAGLERQVRIIGSVAAISAQESNAYFATRPRDAQLGAIASRQSQQVASREVLEATVGELAATIGDGEIARPAYWGGYELAPKSIEFWQGRSNRLNDRLRYDQDGDSWALSRLMP